MYKYVIHCLLRLLPTLFLAPLAPQISPAAASSLQYAPPLDTNSWCRPRSCSTTKWGQVFHRLERREARRDSTEYHRRCIYMGKSNYHHVQYHIPPLSLLDPRPSQFHPGAPAPDLQLWPSVIGVWSPGWPASWRRVTELQTPWGDLQGLPRHRSSWLKNHTDCPRFI